MLKFKEFLIEANMGSVRGKDAFKTLIKSGYQHSRTNGSHRVLKHPTKGSYTFSFSDHESIGHPMLSRISKATQVPVEKFHEEVIE